MKPPNIDWQYLRQGLTGPLVLLTVCVMLWGASAIYRAQAVRTLDGQRESLASLGQERSELATRRSARRQFTTLYRQLRADGVLGGDQRLIWTQNTRDAGYALNLPYLRYTTGPQRVFEAPWLAAGTSAPVMVSVMDVQLGLVHERDLLQLLTLLRESPGLLQVQSCALERLGNNSIPEPDKANVTGNCQLAWFSVPREGILSAASTESQG